MVPIGSEKGVVLQKIDEDTYAGKSGDVEQFLFCPACKATFISSEMKEAYKEHVRLVAEEKSERASREAFNKESADAEGKFTKISNSIFFLLVFCVPMYFVLDFIFSQKIIFWVALGVVICLGASNIIYVCNFNRKREKCFKEFKAKHSL